MQQATELKAEKKKKRSSIPVTSGGMIGPVTQNL
jgi:hypothetical protein